MQGPLARFYSVRILGTSIDEYIEWRRRCGNNYFINLTVQGNTITGTETYTFDTEAEVDYFMSLILGLDSVAAFDRPWNNIIQAQGAAKQNGLSSLVSYKIAPDGTTTEVYNITT